jgi:uncharacterized 2Fe-2S/4Fe-4S cluster protein (DUF4445 family)
VSAGKPSVDVLSGGQRRPAELGRSLFDYADDLALDVPASCLRTGRCRECVVEVLSGGSSLSRPAGPETFLFHGFRLACQARIERRESDIEFQSVRRALRILTSTAEDVAIDLDPAVTLADGVVWYMNEPIEPLRGRVLGLAVDLGTTTIVLELVDLLDGTRIALGALENPQRFGGSDVMTRIAYESLNPGQLRRSVRRAVNRELRRLYATAGVDRHEVYEVFLVGNTTMRDLFFGLDPAPIGRSPFRSTTEQAVRDGTATDSGITRLGHEVGLLVHPKARVVGGPLIGCHVGADAAADLVAAGVLDDPEPFMLIDIGTNTEVIAGTGGRILAASCPAGPAFEGGAVDHAMAAAEGAIESIDIREGRFTWRTVGDAEPVGICGSGLVDLLAELLRVGRLTSRGRFSDDVDRVEFVPGPPVALSRSDVSQLAQAKSANQVGQLVLLRSLDLVPTDLARLFLAGGFANQLDVRKAVDIGLLLPVAEDRVRRLGNASLRGARMLLLSVALRARLAVTVRRIEHVELESEGDFFDLYVDGCLFGPAGFVGTRPGAGAA